MIEINAQNLEKFEKPEQLTPDNIVHWSHTYKELVDRYGKRMVNTMHHKAVIFLREDLIKYSKDEKCYYCKMLKGYNTTDYKMKYNKELKRHECECQGFQTKFRKGEEPICSHTLALKYHWKMQHWNEKQKNEFLNDITEQEEKWNK